MLYVTILEKGLHNRICGSCNATAMYVIVGITMYGDDVNLCHAHFCILSEAIEEVVSKMT